MAHNIGVIFIALGLLVLCSQARSQPDAVLYALQEKCGRQAAETFHRDWGTNIVNNKEGSTIANYNNHFSQKLNKCFYLEITSTYSKSSNVQSRALLDLNENKDYGSFSYGSELGLIDCQVQGHFCKSEQEWRELTRPFLED